MTFVPYNWYYVIDSDTLVMLQEFLDPDTLESFMADFEEVDGIFYAPLNAVDEAETLMLAENNLAIGKEYYAKSYQSTRFF